MIWLVALALAGEPDPPVGGEVLGDAARGEVLAGLGACRACHTDEGGADYAGSYAIEAPQGVFFGPNLTGLDWDFADFERAMRRGVSPAGRPYYPAFPYTSYTRMSDADLADLWAFLQTLPRSAAPNERHDLRFPYGVRALLWPWRWASFQRGPMDPSDRGAYLVNGPGHCGECHTPRGPLGAVRKGKEHAGSHAPPEPSPNITAGGLRGWSADDVADYLESGMTPDGDFAGGVMRAVIREGTSQLSAEDRRAIADYLLAVPPVEGPPEEEEEEW